MVIMEIIDILTGNCANVLLGTYCMTLLFSPAERTAWQNQSAVGQINNEFIWVCCSVILRFEATVCLISALSNVQGEAAVTTHMMSSVITGCAY